MKKPGTLGNHPYNIQEDVDDHDLLRKLAKSYPSEVPLRVEWIIFYETVGKCSAKETASHFGISRKTFHKWSTRFKISGRKVSSLADRSKVPHNLRKPMVTLLERTRIRNLRNETKRRIGKVKLKVFYQRKYQEEISTWKIESVIRSEKLFPNPAEHTRRVAKRRRGKRRLRVPEVDLESFKMVVHIDTIILWLDGVRRIIFTALIHNSRIGFARMYKTNSSANASDFIKRIRYVLDCPIEVVHSDNGAEFELVFDVLMKKWKVLRVYSRVRTPKDNARLERFNRSLQELWMLDAEVDLMDVGEVNRSLTDWLVFYNWELPHQALDYATPLEYAENLKVLPMSSASTHS